MSEGIAGDCHHLLLLLTCPAWRCSPALAALWVMLEGTKVRKVKQKPTDLMKREIIGDCGEGSWTLAGQHQGNGCIPKMPWHTFTIVYIHKTHDHLKKLSIHMVYFCFWAQPLKHGARRGKEISTCSHSYPDPAAKISYTAGCESVLQWELITVACPEIRAFWSYWPKPGVQPKDYWEWLQNVYFLDLPNSSCILKLPFCFSLSSSLLPLHPAWISPPLLHPWLTSPLHL